jgi:hypothetical protein
VHAGCAVRVAEQARALSVRDLRQVSLLTTYLLCELLNHGAFVINFVLVTLLMAVEFWYVKVRTRQRETRRKPSRACAQRCRRAAVALTLLRPAARCVRAAERERAQAGGAALLELHQRRRHQRVAV